MSDPIRDLANAIVTEARETKAEFSESADWCDLTEEEAWIFDIDLTDFPLMVTAFDCFQAFNNFSSGGHFEGKYKAELEVARAARPDLVQPYTNAEEFQKFCHALGVLTYRQAFQYFLKYEAVCLRHGITEFTDEAN